MKNNKKHNEKKEKEGDRDKKIYNRGRQRERKK